MLLRLKLVKFRAKARDPMDKGVNYHVQRRRCSQTSTPSHILGANHFWTEVFQKVIFPLGICMGLMNKLE
jgi:hypothetical protein